MSAPILLVEDNPDDVLFLQRAFKATAITAPLRVLTDGEAAIAYLAGNGAFADRAAYPLPALMLLDLNMPRVSGFDVLRWLRQQPGLKRLPVVVLTSSAQDEDVTRAYDLGANSYVLKPSGLAQINEVAKQIEGYWLSVNQRPPLADQPR
jgi:CheY-like chemotaxis protein